MCAACSRNAGARSEQGARKWIGSRSLSASRYRPTSFKAAVRHGQRRPAAPRTGLGDRAGLGIRLDVRRQHQQAALGTVRLEVHAGHQAVAQQERQYVVPPRPPGPRHEDLDSVVEVKEPRHARPAPHQWVEERQPPSSPTPTSSAMRRRTSGTGRQQLSARPKARTELGRRLATASRPRPKSASSTTLGSVPIPTRAPPPAPAPRGSIAR